jgi:branched-chain amino acid transport system permease protein
MAESESTSTLPEVEVVTARPGPAGSAGGSVMPAFGRRLSPLVNGPIVIGVILLLLGLIISRQDYLLQGSTALAYALAASGLGLALGLSGEFVLAQGAIVAVGAYVTGALTVHHLWSFWTAALVGSAAAMVVGLVLSILGLRVSRFYFALVGFFLVYLTPNILQIFESQTGGTAGLPVIDQPNFFGTVLGFKGMFFLSSAVLVIGLLFVRNVRASPIGIHMRRMRESPAVVATSGVPTWRIRTSTYAISSLLAGAAGAVLSHVYGFLQPGDFNLNTTILLFAAVLVGGSTTLLGPSLGVIVLYVIPHVVINAESYTELIYGAIVLISVIAFRGGVERALRDASRAVATRLHRRYPSFSFSFSRGRGPVATRELDARHEQTPAPASVPAATLGSGESLVALVDEMREQTTRGRADGRLAVTGARKRYGGLAALDLEDDDCISVNPGEVHLLLGPNGSGKTTLLNSLSGLTRLDHGKLELGDRDVTRYPVARIAKLGVSRSFQSPSLPDEVTPRELLAALIAQMRSISYFHWFLADPVVWRAKKESLELAGEILDAGGLGDVADEQCLALTSGRRRILDVLAALTSHGRILLLDEPAAGLSDPERRSLGATVRALAERGFGFLVVEHDLDLALSIADRVTVLANGKILAQGTSREVQANPEVRAVIMGSHA